MRNASMLNDLLLSRSWNTDSDTHPFLLGTRCSHLKSRHTQRCALKQMDLWIITRNFSLDRTPQTTCDPSNDGITIEEKEKSSWLNSYNSLLQSEPAMTEYGHYITPHQKPAPLSSHDPIKEKKAARRKLLDEVEQRRAENYKRFMEKKHRL